MEKMKRSRTAEGAAAMRASHTLYENPKIFEDPFAYSLLSLPWQKALTVRWLHRLVFGFFMRPLIPVQGQVLARARFTEDRLISAIENGVKQVVIVGAGLDTFSLRHPEVSDEVRVFEVDHPASQAFKKHRLKKTGINLPGNLEFVAADLEKQNLSLALNQSSFNQELPTFFYWLGVTVYLTEEAIFNTLESITYNSAKDSELIFDYASAIDNIPFEERSNIKLLQFYTDRFGEPIIDNKFDPDKFIRKVADLGFKLITNMSPEEQKQTYFSNRTDKLRPVSGSYFAHLKKI